MNEDLDSYLALAIVSVLVLILSIIFQEPLRLLIRRIRRFTYKDAKGRKVKVESDAESSLSAFVKRKQDQAEIDKKQSLRSPATMNIAPSVVISSLPNRLYSSLIGRTDEIHRALQFLRSSRTGTMLGLDGLGGIGKTALAREIAEISLEEKVFQLVYWTTAKRFSLEREEITISPNKKVTYNSILSSIANWLGIGSELNRIRDRSAKERRIKEILDAVPSLIIVDNLETVDMDQSEVAINLKKILGRSKAILASRQRWSRSADIFSITVQGLSPDKSIRLMKTIAIDRHIERVESADPL